MTKLDYTKGKVNSSAGFSLIEVVIASAVLAVGLLGLMTLQTTMTRTNTRSNTMSQTTALISGQIEMLLQAPFSGADLTAGPHTRNDLQTGYNVDWTVTDNSPVLGAKAIVLTVVSTNVSSAPMDFMYVRYDDGS